MPVVVRDRLLISRGLDRAYRLLGVRPDCHELVLAKARTALLALSKSDRRDAQIEASYARIRRHRMAEKKGTG